MIYVIAPSIATGVILFHSGYSSTQVTIGVFGGVLCGLLARVLLKQKTPVERGVK